MPYAQGTMPVLGVPHVPRALFFCPIPLGLPHNFFSPTLSDVPPKEAAGDHRVAHDNQTVIVLYSFYCFLLYYNHYCKKEKNKKKRKKTRKPACCPSCLY